MMRMSRRLWMLLFVALLAGCGGKTPPLTKLGPNDVVLAFGDSLTYGTGAAEAESYPAVLGTLIGRNVVRAGVPGEVTEQGLQRLPSALETYKPKLVLLCLGGNDMLRKLDDGRTSANLKQMIATIRASGAAVVLLGVPKPALFGGPARFYGEIAQELGVAYDGDIITGVLRDNGLKSDPIHPNAQGYRKIAEQVAALLKKGGAI